MASKVKKKAQKEAVEKKVKKQAAKRKGPKPIAKKPPMLDDKVQIPSDKLAAVIGNAPTSFRRANRQVWLYVQRRGFRSRQDKRIIQIKRANPDKPELLETVLGKTVLSMFEMSRILRRELQ